MKLYKTHAITFQTLWGFCRVLCARFGNSTQCLVFFEERGRPELGFHHAKCMLNTCRIHAEYMPNTAKGPCFPVSPRIPQRFFCKRTKRCFPEAETILCVLAKRADENDKDMCGTWGETKYSRLDLPH